jgi:hypothetical protein
MTKKTRPAPLGATYKLNVRIRWSRQKPDVAPNGAKPVLFGCGYKDFAPTELARSVTTHPNSLWSFSLCSLRSSALRQAYGVTGLRLSQTS